LDGSRLTAVTWILIHLVLFLRLISTYVLTCALNRTFNKYCAVFYIHVFVGLIYVWSHLLQLHIHCTTKRPCNLFVPSCCRFGTLHNRPLAEYSRGAICSSYISLFNSGRWNVKRNSKSQKIAVFAHSQSFELKLRIPN